MVVANILKASLVVGFVVLIWFFIMSFTQYNSDQDKFEKFIVMYNKSYVSGTEEHRARFNQFKVRLQFKCTTTLCTYNVGKIYYIKNINRYYANNNSFKI